MSLRNARALQVLGLLIAVVGLLGYWLNRDIPDKTELTPDQLEVIGVDPAEKAELFTASFVVAGRDYDIASYASPCRYVGRRCVRDTQGEFRLGKRTDTIMCVQIIGDKITMINIPRDVWLPQWQTRINAIYGYQGAEGLKTVVEEIVGLPIDYYSVISIDIFQELVDALGGVDIHIPYDMYWEDAAAGLLIDFKEGPAHLNGEDASKFVRYRHTLRGDIDRIDNVKLLANAMLARVKALNVRAAFKAPEIVDAVFDNIETNASPALVKTLLPRLASLQLEAATLPTGEIEGKGVLFIDDLQVENFLADTFGGEPRVFASPPEITLLITNRSGEPDLAEIYKRRLLMLGVDEANILLNEGSSDPSQTHILTTSQHWQEADFYTSLLHTSKQQVDRFSAVEGRNIDLELILGTDAATSTLARAQGSGVKQPALQAERGD